MVFPDADGAYHFWMSYTGDLLVPWSTKVCGVTPSMAHLFAPFTFESWISACSASRPQKERSRLFFSHHVWWMLVKDPHSFSPQPQPGLYWWIGSFNGESFRRNDQKKPSGLIVTKPHSALTRLSLCAPNGCSPSRGSWNAGFSTWRPGI